MSTFLTNEDYSIISRLLTFFSTSYGSNARLKLIQTLDSSMSVCTSISSRIQYQLKCRHLIARLLSAAIQKQTSTYHDGGLYFSIVFCNFLLQFRDTPMDSSKKTAVFEQCLDLLEQLILPKVTITFDSIQQLLAITRAVICKPLAYKNSDQMREQICLLSVKSFLENITMIDSSQRQLILTIEGLSIEESNLYSGLLYQIPTTNSTFNSQTTRPCLYFTISLAGDYLIDDVDHIETEKQMFEWIQQTGEQIVTQIIKYSRLLNGGLILCQKVIHPSVKVKLKQYGIETIDRLGGQYTPYLCYLTGCQPISTLTLNTLDERYFGTLTEIKRLRIGEKRFLQFFNRSRPFHTLLLCSDTEQALLELKECITASHHVLSNTLTTRHASYGGGCSESVQIRYLKTQVHHAAVRYFSKTLGNIIRAHCDDDYVIDRVHGHLWCLSDNDQISETCACELYSASDRFRRDWRMFSFFLDDEKQEERSEDVPELFIRQICPKYLDDFHMKTNALKTAIETAINLHLTNVCL